MQSYYDVVTDSGNRPIAGAQVFVYTYDGNLATLYGDQALLSTTVLTSNGTPYVIDQDLLSPQSNPIVTGVDGTVQTIVTKDQRDAIDRLPDVAHIKPRIVEHLRAPRRVERRHHEREAERPQRRARLLDARNHAIAPGALRTLALAHRAPQPRVVRRFGDEPRDVVFDVDAPEAAPAQQQEVEPSLEPALESPAPKRPRAKGKRASVPSWDDILFGKDE